MAARADRVVARVRALGSGQVVAVAHGHIIRVLAARWLGAPPDAGRWLIQSTAGISHLGWERDDAVIQHWNDVTHLEPT